MAKSSKQYSAVIAVACLLGAALSAYSLYVEIRVEEDSSYEAMCDISEEISCSKVLKSEYSRGLGLVAPILGQDSILNQSNGLFGLIFYTLVTILGLTRNLWAAKFQIFLVQLSICMSIYFAYLLYFVLKDLCVVCISTYVVNIILLVLVFKRYGALVNESTPKSSGSGATKKKSKSSKSTSKKNK